MTAPRAVQVRRIQPHDSAAWRTAARPGWGGSHLAHAPEWATVIRGAYGHDPMYLTAEDSAGRTGCLPAFVVRRPFLGTIVTSMPFLDGGGPSAGSASLASRLVDGLLDEARQEGAATVELRCSERLEIACRPMEHKVNMVLPLTDGADLWQRLDRSVRNQVRKAERAGVSVEFGHADKLEAFYGLFAGRMRDLGSPVHAMRFFEAVLDAFGQRARITLVRKGATPIGGLVALACGDTVAVPWASCAKEYFALCPNMLLYWETIRRASLDGFERFEFGRSTRGSGTWRFKRQWGAVETPLYWYRIPVNGGAEVALSDGGHAAACLAALWRRLPMGVTRRLGPPVRRYLIQ